MKTIVFICVNFNNSDFTKAFCESLLIQNGLGLNIALRCVIVDNSTDEIDSNNLLQYSKKIPWVDYRKANDNLGYFGGLNYGLNLIKSVVYDYVVICNNDLVFDAQFCERLLPK